MPINYSYNPVVDGVTDAGAAYVNPMQAGIKAACDAVDKMGLLSFSGLGYTSFAADIPRGEYLVYGDSFSYPPYTGIVSGQLIAKNTGGTRTLLFLPWNQQDIYIAVYASTWTGWSIISAHNKSFDGLGYNNFAADIPDGTYLLYGQSYYYAPYSGLVAGMLTVQNGSGSRYLEFKPWNSWDIYVGRFYSNAWQGWRKITASTY